MSDDCPHCGVPYVATARTRQTIGKLGGDFADGPICFDINHYEGQYNSVNFYAHPETLFVVESRWPDSDWYRFDNSGGDVFARRAQAESRQIVLGERNGDAGLETRICEVPTEEEQRADPPSITDEE